MFPNFFPNMGTVLDPYRNTSILRTPQRNSKRSHFTRLFQGVFWKRNHGNSTWSTVTLLFL
jgi:hypothetical protein